MDELLTWYYANGLVINKYEEIYSNVVSYLAKGKFIKTMNQV